MFVILHQPREFAEILILHRVQITRGKAGAERAGRFVSAGTFDRRERMQRPQAGDGGRDVE